MAVCESRDIRVRSGDVDALPQFIDLVLELATVPGQRIVATGGSPAASRVPITPDPKRTLGLHSNLWLTPGP